MAKVVIDKERCKGCQLCVFFCRKEILRMSEEINSKGHHPCEFIEDNEQNCTGCALCAIMCPDVAIEVYK